MQARGGNVTSLLPIIYLESGRLPWIVDQTERALLDAGGCEIYQRGGVLVTPIKFKVEAADKRETFTWQLHLVEKALLVDVLSRIIRFQRFDIKKGDWVDKDCPEKVAETYLSRAGRWKVPPLRGVVNTPFLRKDGSICERPGYDAASKLLFDPESETFPAVPDTPSQDDALTAIGYLDEMLLEEFPFVDEVDRAVALSAFLTAFERQVIKTAPLHGFSSPDAGTGKSLLVDLISILRNGELAPVIAQGRNDDELDKRLGTALISGDGIISLDNCGREVESDFLCQALTQTRLKIRLLGHSRQLDVPIATTFFATGNNLVVASDLTRRTLLCRLDAKVERPETRIFKRNVIETAYEKRGELVQAILTILRAWQVTKQSVNTEPMGSFEDWSRRVRSPLIWLGYADPCDSIQKVRENDPRRDALTIVLEQWALVLGKTGSYTVQQVITRAISNSDLFGAIATVAATEHGTLSNDKLGRWLKKNDGRIAGKLKLKTTGKTYGFPLWQVSDA
jgi:putative DNA primase/helicase